MLNQGMLLITIPYLPYTLKNQKRTKHYDQ
jgi:hypothetical protein